MDEHRGGRNTRLLLSRPPNESGKVEITSTNPGFVGIDDSCVILPLGQHSTILFHEERTGVSTGPLLHKR